MTRTSVRLALLALLLPVPVLAAGDYWVTTDRLDRRTCPRSSCGVVGQLFFRENADVLEVKSGWARISRYYDASCKNGRSEYVDRGRSDCTTENGIVDGQFAEWVLLQSLSKTRPADPGAGAQGDAALVAGSDDFRLHKDAFAKAARSLIDRGTCTAKDFQDNGGWMKSTTTYRDRPVYFTYCGGTDLSNRLYLDASTGKTFR